MMKGFAARLLAAPDTSKHVKRTLFVMIHVLYIRVGFSAHLQLMSLTGQPITYLPCFLVLLAFSDAAAVSSASRTSMLLWTRYSLALSMILVK